ncbi:hypothetical protein GTY23_23150 [Streptomyces sp. SID5998]|nr:hypothetical protein [Streptomyces sp. SID5998]
MTRTQSWTVSLEDSVSALGVAARECQSAYRASVLAKNSVDLDRLRLLDGKILRRSATGHTTEQEPHLAAVSRVGSILLQTEFQLAALYEQTARAYAHGTTWAVQQVLAGHEPAHVELQVLADGVHYHLADSLPALPLDRYARTPALETARRDYERCLAARFEAEGIGAQSDIADHEAGAMHEALVIASGIPDAAYAYGVQAEGALHFAITTRAQAVRE